MANALRSSTPSDFNGDGRSDLLLQNNSFDVFIYGLNGPAVVAGYKVGNTGRNGGPGPAYHVVGIADFNGDGQADIITEEDDGYVVGLQMNGTAVTAATVIFAPGMSGASESGSTHLRGLGDFNGDGRADTVVQYDNGTLMIFTNSAANPTSAIPHAVGTLPSGWTIEGVADFNGDGQLDLLAQSNTGEIVTYLMNGFTIMSGHSLGNPGPGWSVAGTGDYNGDGKADIVLHNDGGGNVIWNTDGSSVTGAKYLGNPGASWNNVITGLDINGDGNADLVLQNQDSTLVGFTLDSNATINAQTVLGTPGPGWRAAGNNPIWYSDGSYLNSGSVQAATIGVDQFAFLTALTGPHYVTGFNPAQDMIALSKSAFPSYAALQAAEQPYQGGTFIGLTSNTGTPAAVIIQGVTPDQLSAANFILR